jgi:flavin reductase (DIM6/NTAB) family NADH-FMN oxidoreductase RutF
MPHRSPGRADSAFDAIMEPLDPPLVIVTTAAADERAGCLVGFHGQCSIEPRRYCVWLSRANHTYRVALRSQHLAIHFLTAADITLAERFGGLTGDRTDKFAGLDVVPGPGDVPLLRQCGSWLAVLRTGQPGDGGDHACMITAPVAVHGGRPFEPLRLSAARHIVPGHEAAEAP